MVDCSLQEELRRCIITTINDLPPRVHERNEASEAEDVVAVIAAISIVFSHVLREDEVPAHTKGDQYLETWKQDRFDLGAEIIKLLIWIENEESPVGVVVKIAHVIDNAIDDVVLYLAFSVGLVIILGAEIISETCFNLIKTVCAKQ